MANHEESCENSQKLCERLFDALKLQQGEISCEKGGYYCSYRGPSRIFAYIKHCTKHDWILIWFRGSAQTAAHFQHLTINPRSDTDGTWQKFGGSFRVSNSLQLNEAVEFLLNISHPLS